MLFLCSKLHSLFRQHPDRAAHCLYFCQGHTLTPLRLCWSFSLPFSMLLSSTDFILTCVSEHTRANYSFFKFVGTLYLFGFFSVERCLRGKMLSSLALSQQTAVAKFISIRQLHQMAINKDLVCILKVVSYFKHERTTNCITNNRRRMSKSSRTFAGSFLLNWL